MIGTLNWYLREGKTLQVEDYIQKQENKGKKTLQFLIIINMILFTLVLIISLMNGVFKNIISIIIILILCLFIYYGGNIAKWIYIVINAINIISLLAALLYGQVMSNVPVYLNLIT